MSDPWERIDPMQMRYDELGKEFIKKLAKDAVEEKYYNSKAGLLHIMDLLVRVVAEQEQEISILRQDSESWKRAHKIQTDAVNRVTYGKDSK